MYNSLYMQLLNDNSIVKQLTTTVTQRGQATIPAEVLRLLGTKPKDKIGFQINGNEVRLIPAAFTLESAYGSVQPLHKPENFKEIIQSVKEEKAQRTMPKRP